MTIRVVTDSTCDLPAEVRRLHNISVIPLIITADARELRDGVDITRGEFYAQLPDFRHSPKTAAPGPEAFREVYERLAAEGADQILSIHISQKLSLTIESARQAAADTRTAEVTAFDSRQLSLGTGFEVLAAASAAEQGRTLPEILDLLDGQIRRTHVCAALDTLEFMRRGGRMNGAITALGNLLQVKPILKMYDGEPSAERVRTRARVAQATARTDRATRPVRAGCCLAHRGGGACPRVHEKHRGSAAGRRDLDRRDQPSTRRAHRPRSTGLCGHFH